MNELSININIAGRAYPLTVSSEEEARVRAAGKLIHEKLQAYAGQFALRDHQDALAMFALEIASEYQKLLERDENEQVELESKLKEINHLLPPLS